MGVKILKVMIGVRYVLRIKCRLVLDLGLVSPSNNNIIGILCKNRHR